jgi:predicted transcriptional regulator
MKESNMRSIKATLEVLTNQPQSFKDISAKVGKDRNTIRTALNALIDLGLVEKVVAPRALWISNRHHPFFAWKKVEKNQHS